MFKIGDMVNIVYDYDDIPDYEIIKIEEMGGIPPTWISYTIKDRDVEKLVSTHHIKLNVNATRNKKIDLCLE